jgi:iron complex transport system substrate-binding protein
MFNKNFSKKYIILLIFTLSIALMLTACGQAEENTVEGEENQNNTRIVVDQAGREVEIPKEVNRVVTCWRPCTFLAFAVGGQDKLVGSDGGSTANPFLKGVYPEVSELTQIGDKTHGINIEEVVSTNPDVVFVWNKKGSDTTIEQLESQGIAAVVIYPESIERMKEATKLMGEVMGCNEQATKILNYYDEKMAMIQEKIADVPEEGKPKVYLAGAHGILSTCSGEFYQHFIIENAGGNDVAGELKGGWNEVSPEQLVAWNPDVMVAVQFCKEGMDEAVKMDPGLKTINAVKNNELYRFPSNIASWDFPEPMSILGTMWLAKTLYPEKFADFDFESEVNKFHEDFYGKSFTELGGKINDKGIKKMGPK